MKELMLYIKASRFLPDFCNIENTPLTRHKTNGKGDKGRPKSFDEKEKKQIRAGIKKLCLYLKSVEIK